MIPQFQIKHKFKMKSYATGMKIIKRKQTTQRSNTLSDGHGSDHGCRLYFKRPNWAKNGQI